jgi:hypothetical protein
MLFRSCFAYKPAVLTHAIQHVTQVKRILAHSELHFSSLNALLDQRASLMLRLEEHQQQQMACLQQEQQQQQQCGQRNSSCCDSEASEQQQQQVLQACDWSQITPPLELVEQLVTNLKQEHLLKVSCYIVCYKFVT